ncbi:MAG: porin family protein [Desulfuromusa sp.]|nr:porin family protein [Desulfuromusa sp.]
MKIFSFFCRNLSEIKYIIILIHKHLLVDPCLEGKKTMKKALVVLLSLVIFVGFAVSTASAGAYVSGNLGASFLMHSDFKEDGHSGKITYDGGGAATVALGTSIFNGARIEAEIGARKNDLDDVKFSGLGSRSIDGDVTTTSLMGNVYYDFKNETRFITSIGGGLGVANVDFDFDDFSNDDDTVVAYQLMLGVGYPITKQIVVELQYRFFGTADPDIDGTDLEYYSHNVLLGLRYGF